MEERKIVEACIEGNEFAQRVFYDRFKFTMMGICLRYSKTREEAEDVLQEGFVKVFRHLQAFKFEGSLEGWVKKIMVNVAIENYRKENKRYDDVSLDKTEFIMSVPENQISTMAAKDILKFIQALPEGYRMVFNLYAIEGYSHAEIAAQLGISENTSYSQYSRAKALLRKILDKQNGTHLKKVI